MIGLNNNIINKTTIFILWVLLILVAIFMYFGYLESTLNYNNLYSSTYGKIISSELEQFNVTFSDQINGLNTFSTEIMYKLKNNYAYVINNKKYFGYFYNDEFDDYDKKIKFDELKILYKKYDKNYPLKIHYLKSDVTKSSVNLDLIRDKNSKFYYGLSCVFFVLMTIILFFSNFFINNYPNDRRN